ncbi:MAG: hypothetical protein QOH21_2369, partial [Acidobacteriota bacterium]|nr:hypothetical protein [Acidobacteriota bacterium]
MRRVEAMEAHALRLLDHFEERQRVATH